MAREHEEWISRVLGITVSRSGGAGVDLTTAAAGWRSASDAVDAQISALQRALRGAEDSDLQSIAEYGLNAVTGNFRVPLLAALMGAERGNSPDRDKLGTAIQRFRDHLESDDRVEACDENPFGVAVAIRATLIPALDALTRSLAGPRA